MLDKLRKKKMLKSLSTEETSEGVQDIKAELDKDFWTEDDPLKATVVTQTIEKPKKKTK